MCGRPELALCGGARLKQVRVGYLKQVRVGYLKRVRVGFLKQVRRLLGQGALDELGELARLVHLGHDVAPADELAADEDLRSGGR